MRRFTGLGRQPAFADLRPSRAAQRRSRLAAARSASDGARPQRSALASSSVFLATATPAPSAIPETAPSAKPMTTAVVAASPPTKTETAATVPIFPANTPYANARVDLLALGYGPAPLPHTGKCDSTTDSTCFPERMACAKTGGIECYFLWRRGEQVIKVRPDAIPPTVSSVECQVNCK